MNCPWEEKKNGKSVYVESEQVSEVEMNYINQLVKPKKTFALILSYKWNKSQKPNINKKSIKLYLDLKDD